jgi:type I restriction enzyme S subunit
MSNKAGGVVTEGDGQALGLVPKLRFPEFRDAGAWVPTPLRDTCEPISEKVGSVKLTPVSISAGRGFVSQADKFGRDISGVQYRNYTYLRKGDFAYNKGNSLSFPQGYICQLREFDEAAASSAFICFRLHKGHQPAYFQALFDQNIHGRQLTSFITSGARSNGLLNIRTDDFYGVKIPLPADNAEQEKIADCLSSLDAVIAAEGDRLAALKDHKKGLMQQLFPAPNQTAPHCRFPEFQGKGEWEMKTIGSSSMSFSGGTPSSTEGKFYGGEIPFIRSAEIGDNQTELMLSRDGLTQSAAKMVSVGDVLLALYGANSGNAALARIDGAINQAVLCIRHESNNRFLFQFLCCRQLWIRQTYLQGGQGNISGDIVKSIPIPTPSPPEQSKIANFFGLIDISIESQADKVVALKRHKAALMQQLFPSPYEAEA